MRVICVIKLKNYSGKKPFYTSPEVGEECTVVKTVKSKLMTSGTAYSLSEYDGFLYDSRAFATLPDATADEMQEVEREAILM